MVEEMYGCYSCGTVNGSFQEHLDGTVICETCGEETVLTIEEAFALLVHLNEIGLFEKATIEELELFSE